MKGLETDFKELCLSFIAGTVLLNLIGLLTIIFAPSHRLLVAMLTLPFMATVIFSAVMGLNEGRAFYWFAFWVSVFGLVVVIFTLATASLLNIKVAWVLGALCISLLISCFFSWRWGASIFNQETMKEVLASKRIDIEKSTYSPFAFPFGILKTKSSKKWFLIANTSGPILITLSVVLVGTLGRHVPDIGNMWGILCAYVSVVLLIGGIRASLGEYAWIRKWEKQTGRKMYISYVVDWRRFKEEEKKRNHAERARLNASKN